MFLATYGGIPKIQGGFHPFQDTSRQQKGCWTFHNISGDGSPQVTNLDSPTEAFCGYFLIPTKPFEFDGRQLTLCRGWQTKALKQLDESHGSFMPDHTGCASGVHDGTSIRN